MKKTSNYLFYKFRKKKNNSYLFESPNKTEKKHTTYSFWSGSHFRCSYFTGWAGVSIHLRDEMRLARATGIKLNNFIWK